MLKKALAPKLPADEPPSVSTLCRHGLTAEIAVLHNENAEDFQQMLEAFQAEHQPVGPTENLLVHQMVMAAWRLQRLRGIETGLFDLRMDELSERMERDHTALEQIERQAFVFLDDARNSRAIENLFRYETWIERAFYRALHELEHLREGREPASHPGGPTPASDPPAPDAAPLEPQPAQPKSSSQLTNSAKQSHSQDRTNRLPPPSIRHRPRAPRCTASPVDDMICSHEHHDADASGVSNDRLRRGRAALLRPGPEGWPCHRS